MGTLVVWVEPYLDRRPDHVVAGPAAPMFAQRIRPLCDGHNVRYRATFGPRDRSSR